ncbi:hypothetical protein M8J75_001743 [Diaphorina citri]|nr:hypothetical protein M8J75_001743 [Diaphorina citri]
MWFMTTIHPPLKSYRQNVKTPISTKQLLEENNNINLIVHPVPNKVNQYVDLPVENQIGGGGIEVTTLRYPNAYRWTKNELKPNLPQTYANSLKTSEINDINNNLLTNPNLNEIPGPPVNIRSTTQKSLSNQDPFNDFNNILINSKLFKHFNAITSYSPPSSSKNNMSPKDLNNFMTNSLGNLDMKSTNNNTSFMDSFRNLNVSPKEVIPSTKEFFGNLMPSKAPVNNVFSNSIKPTSNELYDMNNYGNKMNSEEQAFHSAENMVSPNINSQFENTVKSMNKPFSSEMDNTMYFNMDTLPKGIPDSGEINVNLNSIKNNNMFSNENVPSLEDSSSKDIPDMNYFVTKSNMDSTELKFNSKDRDVPNSNSYADQFNMYLNNINGPSPVYINGIRTVNPHTFFTNTLVDTDDAKNLNNMDTSNINMAAPNLETDTMVNANPDNTRMVNPNFVDWEKELFNTNYTNNFLNVDLKKLRPQSQNEKENRMPVSTQAPAVTTYRPMAPSGPSQPMRPVMGQKNNNQPPNTKSNAGPARPSTDQTKSFYPSVPSNGYPSVPSNAYPSSSHFQVVFRWKIIDFVFRDNKQKVNLIRSNKFIPENNLPLGIGIWRSTIFLSFPKWKAGIPFTLASFNMNDPSESPILLPYPNWSYFDDSNCNSLISVFRMSVDKCDRLWIMDTGVTNILSSIQQLCPPKIMVFDLKTNTLIRKYILPTAQVFEGSLFSNIVTEVVEDCDHVFAYVNDVFRYGLIVYDFFKNTSYRLTHPYMYPEPTQSTYILDNLKFRWVDGIFGMAISPELSGKYKRHPYEYYHYNVHHYNGTNVDKTIRDDQRYMYFHSMSSNRHYYVSTTDLRNSSRYVNSSDIDEYFHYLGSRFRNTQASASAINSNGVMFYNLVTKHSVGCWNTKTKVYLPQTQDIVQTSRDILNFPNDLKIDPNDNIWILSNKLHQYLYGFLDFNVYNYRILVANSNDIVRNTKCDPYLSLNNYIHNVNNQYKQCPNYDL